MHRCWSRLLLVASWCCVLLLLGVGIGGAAAVEVVNCTGEVGSTARSVVIVSDREYLLRDCSASVTLEQSNAQPACATNVSIVVVGGAVLPSILFSSTCKLDPSLPGAAIGTRIHVSGVRMLQKPQHTKSWFVMSNAAKQISNVHITATNASLLFGDIETYGLAHGSPFVFMMAFNISNVTVVLVDTNISVAASMELAIVSFTAGYTFPPQGSGVGVAEHLLVDVRRSKLSIALDCTNRTTPCGGKGTTIHVVRACSIRIYVVACSAKNTTIRVLDSHMGNTFAFPPLPTAAAVSAEGIVRIAYDAFAVALFSSELNTQSVVSDLTVFIANCTSVIVASRSAAIFYAPDGVGSTHRFVLTIANTTSLIDVAGRPLSFESSERIATVAFLRGGQYSSLVVLLHAVDAVHAVFSGEVDISAVLVNSTLTVCTSEMTSIRAPVSQGRVDLISNSLTSDLRNGTAIPMFIGATINSVSTGLLVFDKFSLILHLDVTVRNCVVVASSGIRLPSIVANGALFCSVAIVALFAPAANSQLNISGCRLSASPFEVDAATAWQDAVPFIVSIALVVTTNPVVGLTLLLPTLKLVVPASFYVLAVQQHVRIDCVESNVTYLGVLPAIPSSSSSNVGRTTVLSAMSLGEAQYNLTVCLRRIYAADASVPVDHRPPSAMHVLLCIGGCNMSSWRLDACHLQGVSALLTSLGGTVRLRNASLLAFHDIVASPIAPGGDVLVASALSSNEGRTVLRDGSSIAVSACRFSRYGSFADASSHGTTALFDGQYDRWLVLGCNLWDGVGMSVAVIGVPSASVWYPRSRFVVANVSVGECPGIQTPTATISLLSATPSVIPAVVEVPIALADIARRFASVATIGAAFGSVVPRAAVGAMQGVLGLLRLAAECRRGGQTTADAEVAEDPLIGEAVFENPLQLSMDIDAAYPHLRLAAGAVVGNTVFVLIVGGVLHVCARVRAYVEHSVREPRLLQRLVLEVFPRTRAPGCVLIPLAMLLEPLVMMSVLLMAHGVATTALLGAATLTAWVACIAVVAWHVLHVLPFPMDAVVVSRARHSAPASSGVTGRAVHAMHAAAHWMTEPSHEWRLPQSAAQREDAVRLEARYSCVYEPFRGQCHAFFLVELGSTVLTGLLLGAATVVEDPESACSALLWCGSALAALYAATAGLVLWLRPYVVRSDTIALVSIQALCAACAVASTAGSDEAAEVLALIASCVELVALAVGMAEHVSLNVRRMRRSMTWLSLGIGSSPPLVSVLLARRPAVEEGRRAIRGRTTRRPAQSGTTDGNQLRVLIELICEQQIDVSLRAAGRRQWDAGKRPPRQ